MAPHHIWIDCQQQPRLGETFTATLGFGHGFATQGKADPLRARTWLVDPTGTKIALVPQSEAEQTTLRFTPTKPGLYTLLCEYDGRIWSISRDGRHLRGPRSEHPGVDIERSVYSYQFAKTMIALGRDHPRPDPLGVELEIVPRLPGRKELEVAVLYRGRPLAELPVQAFLYSNSCAQVARTDTEGAARFALSEGRWMILAVHADREGADTGGYDERSFTSALTLDLARSQDGCNLSVRSSVAEPLRDPHR